MSELHFSKTGEKSHSWLAREFIPHPVLRNHHLMTVVPGFLPRKVKQFAGMGESRLFAINADAKLLGHCHWQQQRNSPTVIILHGLEGSSESSHVLGIGKKSYNFGFNVVRLNMRNCGGSMAHAQTLYNAGMWEDVQAVMRILNEKEGIKQFFLAGYSLGGNLILNAAAHQDSSAPFKIMAVCAVSPSIDLARSVEAIERSNNRIYQTWFLQSMKKRILEKYQQHPDIYKVDGINNILTIREFDNRFTAPYGGYGTADRYYKEASSIWKFKQIQCPVLIITAEDDPLVPVDSFHRLTTATDELHVVITKHGGHGGFLQNATEEDREFDHFWAENRVVAYMRTVRQEVSSV